MCTKSLSLETMFPEAAVIPNKETASWVMEGMMAAVTVISANKDANGTVVDWDNDDI